MNLALDTNRYSDMARNVPEAVERLEMADRVFVPFIVVGELRAGFLQGRRGRANEHKLREFLEKPGVELLLPTEETTRHYAQAAQQLQRQGTPIPQNDIWIAAMCLQHNLPLYSRDSHFDRLPQLLRI